MTLEEVQLKLESGLESSDVTMEGDGCNCSAVIVSPYLKVCLCCKDSEWFWVLSRKKLKAASSMH